MKKIMLVLCTATLLSSGVEAMQPTQYTVNTTPRVSVVVSQDRINMGGLFCRSLNLSCKSYNGITMLAPLVINADMTQQEIIAALKASFGKTVTVNPPLPAPAAKKPESAGKPTPAPKPALAKRPKKNIFG